jgi:uncharacterized repeat protein (TIGR02543 family)
MTDSGGLWVYDLGMVDWLWTHPSVYVAEQQHPLYAHIDRDWTYHDPETLNPRLFYHYAFDEWREEGTVRVTVDVGEGGDVSGDGIYGINDEVTLIATPDTGYVFTGWGGDASGDSSTATLTADGEKLVTANFRKLSMDEVVDVLFGARLDLVPDDLPELEIQEVVDALFQ